MGVGDEEEDVEIVGLDTGRRIGGVVAGATGGAGAGGVAVTGVGAGTEVAAASVWA